MAYIRPTARLDTHEVTNQPPPLEDINLYDTNIALKEAAHREGADWAEDRFRALGARMGSAEVNEWAVLANRNVPVHRPFDRYGHLVDEVEFHPAYHALMDLGLSHEISSIAWTVPKGGHLAHAVLEHLFAHVEQGVCCPMTMTYAAVPSLRHQPEIARAWEPLITSGTYDSASRPFTEKRGVTLGMAMTEKQGGSDVRANATTAAPEAARGPGQPYRLTGHKWFCSAPMCDAFLTLAYTEGGLTCFLVPRWLPDGTRNSGFRIMRLKDKLGDRSNASSEIEYHDAHGVALGEEGRGLSVIMDMVQHTRLDTIFAPVAFMRQALIQAIWHTRHRSAFQKRLADQPLMLGVLADMALEVEAATALFARIARSYDEAGTSETARAFARLATPVAKYWTNKRCAPLVNEAMECHGGAGYVEESVLPRLYRQAPLNGIWEGSGNVICLDVLRALARHPDSAGAVLQELSAGSGANRHYDRLLNELKDMLARGALPEAQARRFSERLALALQANLLIAHAPHVVSDAFCTARLSGEGTYTFAPLADETASRAIVERALPV